MFLALGTVIFLCAALFPYKAFANQKFQKFLLLISVVALFGLFVVGHVAGNAQSWFRVSNYGIQPGEFVKLTVILYFLPSTPKSKAILTTWEPDRPSCDHHALHLRLRRCSAGCGNGLYHRFNRIVHHFVSGFSGKTLLKLVLLAGIVLVLVSPLIYFNWDSILTEGRMKRFESYQNPFKDAGIRAFKSSTPTWRSVPGDCSAWASAKASRSMGICLKRTPILLWRSSPRSSVFSVSFLSCCCFLSSF